MNGRLVRKTLSFSKPIRLLEAPSSWADALSHVARPLKTRDLQVETNPSHSSFDLVSLIIFGLSRSF